MNAWSSTTAGMRVDGSRRSCRSWPASGRWSSRCRAAGCRSRSRSPARSGAPLEILAVRKLGAPSNPEFAVGAIAEDGTAIVNARRRAARRHDAGAARRDDRARGGASCGGASSATATGASRSTLRGRTVIVVDDGIATGLTDLAAVRALRARGAARIVVAVPVGPAESIALIGDEADEVVCHTIPRDLIGVGRWYRDFSPVSDEEVVALLAQAAAAARGDGRARPRRHAASWTLEVDGGVVLAGDLALPPEPSRPRDLRPRQRLEPAQPAQPRGRGDARRTPGSRRSCSTCSPSTRATGASCCSTSRCSRRAARGRDALGARRPRDERACRSATSARRPAPRRRCGRRPRAREVVRAVVAAAGGPTSPPTGSRS